MCDHAASFSSFGVALRRTWVPHVVVYCRVTGHTRRRPTKNSSYDVPLSAVNVAALKFIR